MSDNPAIIIDNGTGYTKAGIAGEEGPKGVFHACVGYPKNQSAMVGGEQCDFYVGEQAIAKRGVLELRYPVENGIVKSWDDMEKIWRHTFTNVLRVEPSENNVLLTEAPMNPKENREKMTQLMFDTFNVKGLYIAIQAVLSLYSAGKFTGIVNDSGDGVSHFVPIYDGYALPHAVKRLDIAGRNVTEQFTKLLTEIGCQFSTTAEKDIAKDIKEAHCYVALDYEAEKDKCQKINYTLPDGKVITFDTQAYRAPEILFQPKLCGKEGSGFGLMCYESVQACDIDLRKELFQNIILSGGTSLLKGLPERLEKDVKGRVEEAMKGEVKVIASPDRKFSVWLGGSILSSITTFATSWVTAEEYAESGASIVHKKCF